jgi:hypothetical protein
MLHCYGFAALVCCNIRDVPKTTIIGCRSRGAAVGLQSTAASLGAAYGASSAVCSTGSLGTSLLGPALDAQQQSCSAPEFTLAPSGCRSFSSSSGGDGGGAWGVGPARPLTGGHSQDSGVPGPLPAAAVDGASRQRAQLVRDFIWDSLYHPTEGYFTKYNRTGEE